MRSKDFRIHQNNRHKVIAKKYLKQRSKGDSEAVKCQLFSPRSIGITTKTFTLCSCFMCGNPRKYYGNAKASRTIQELRFFQF